MEYTVRFFPGEPRFDAAQVIKLRCAAETDINSRIFAQAQLGRSERLFYIRIWSFETAPSPEARLSLKLERGGRELLAQAGFGGEASLRMDGEKTDGLLTAYLISGEDLQGEYWGAVMQIPTEALLGHFGLDESALPARFKANILRENPEISFAAPPEEMFDLIISPRKG